jgi:hypothetical protein
MNCVGTGIVDPLNNLTISARFQLRNQQHDAMFASFIPSNIVLLFAVSDCDRSRRSQALHSGFWGGPVRLSRSIGEQRKELLLQLVVFRCVRWLVRYQADRGLCTRQFQLGSRIRNPLHHDALWIAHLLARGKSLSVCRFR